MTLKDLIVQLQTFASDTLSKNMCFDNNQLKNRKKKQEKKQFILFNYSKYTINILSSSPDWLE